MYGNYYENYNLVDDSGSKVSGNILLSVETVPNPTVSIALINGRLRYKDL